ncbi:MAG TPA: glycosyltransferase [Rubrobacteraceae bacterium]|jgi:1,2-diacylglycerol 3-beta-galactosyltransferase|nr:glycosyltransferase [Rubrobacteraceae bacterium]
MSAGEHRPEILFATIAAGGGHVAGAHAMSEAIELYYPGRFELRVSDYMKDLGVIGLDRFHKDSWRRALRFPVVARVGQRIIDAFPRATIAAERRILRDFARAAAEDLKRDPPLLVVSNHGLITTGLAEAKHRYGLGVRVLTFATEPFNISAYWGEPRADRLIMASEDGRRRLIRFGVPAEKMTIIGRPVRQAFLNAPAKHEARANLGLEDSFTCLVSFGGEGVGRDARGLISTLLDSDVPLQVVAITGRNEALRKELSALGKDGLRVEGFVENMAEYLAASDVFIGKAGPSSVYEALAVGRPVLASGYAGLNEMGVVRFIENEGLGCHVRTTAALAREVRRYAGDPALLEEVARRCRELNLASRTEQFAHHIVRYALTGA